MFKRIVIKISGEAIGNSNNHDSKFNDAVIEKIVSQVHYLISKGVQVSIVVGGGNFWRGREANETMDTVCADQIGILATIMNGLYLSDFFRQKGIKSEVMTPFDVNCYTKRYTKEKALSYMSKNNVVIFAGGTGHPYFSTDTIVALRACELEVDAVLYAKNIDGVYNCDPRENNDAKKYRLVSYKYVSANYLDVADITATVLTSKANIPSLVFALDLENSIIIACKNNAELYEIGGTLISNNVSEEYYE